MSNELTYSAFESRYRDKQYIGSGGFAKVYKVFDHARNHYVALKVADVRPEWHKFTLKNEVELVNKLPLHRNVARYDACYRFNTGFTGEMDFAVLKFYEYGNLEQFLKKQKITLEDKRLIVQGMLEGIAFLHRHNVIHRDLKSQNILLHREDGVWTPKIIDFGLSREILGDADITNSAIGLSYAYAAPEQIQNKKIFRNVDLWAAGVIMYRVIAEELPFKGRSKGDDRSTQSQLELSRKIVNLELPDKLNTLEEPYQSMIRKCLVLDPIERVQIAEELIEDLSGKRFSIEPPLQKRENIPGEETEIVNPAANVQTPADPGLRTPNAKLEADDSTEIIPPPATPERPSSLAEFPSKYNPPGEEYLVPKANVTQIIDNKPSKEAVKLPPPITDFQPKMGDPKKSSKWWWILLLLLLGGGGGGAWWYQNVYTQPIKIPVGGSPDHIPFQSQEVNTNRFDVIDQENETAQRSRRLLKEMTQKIELLISLEENKTNYRPHFILAKNQAYLGEKYNRKAIQALVDAAAIAIKQGAAQNMIMDMKKEEQEAFKRLKRIGEGKPWTKIIDALEKSLE